EIAADRFAVEAVSRTKERSNAGAGNDTLTGGAEADVFVYLLNWGHDTITNFVATGSEHDAISIDHSIFADWETLFAAIE
ncbi:hypothetical protein ACCT04_36740, partial [Rhizobium ruizarguesonis]